MSVAQPEEQRGPLAEAQQEIAELRAEVARLSQRLADDRFPRQLREVFSLATTAGTIASPIDRSRLLPMILETAAYVTSARAASLYLLEEERRELVVATALGPLAAEVEELRLPLGQGIAGLVAASGQAMIVTDAGNDPRHASNIARALGYLPHSILCVPLLYNEQVIGVLELLDKDDGSAFSATDLEALGLFADQAAVAIEQSRTLHSLAALISRVLQLLGDTPLQRQLEEDAQDFARRIEANPTYRRSLELARLVQEIAQHGESELKVCQTVLGGFVEYLRSRPEPLGNPWSLS